MGNLYEFNIREIIFKYRLNIFIETGSHLGDSIENMCRFNFKRILSAEFFDKYYKHCVDRFKDIQKITLFHGKSNEMLGSMLAVIKPEDKVFFWLDAHLPSNYQLALMGSYDEETEYPLESELKEILKHRDITHDYFIMDDLRMYEEGEFASGPCPERFRYRKGEDQNSMMNFIFDNFNKTHDIEKDYRKEGYIILKPKGVLR